MTVLTPPKYLHPDFLRPDVRPAGPVTLDHSSSLTHGLVRAILPGPGMKDLVSGRRMPYTLGASGDQPWQGSTKGFALTTDGTADSNIALNNEPDAATMSASGFSLSMLARIDSYSTRGGLYQNGDSGGSNGHYIWHEGGYYIFSVNHYLAASRVILLRSFGEWDWITCTYDPDTDALEMYVNGVAATGNTDASPASYNTSNDHYLHDIFVGFGRQMAGQSVVFLRHDRAITPVEAKILHTEGFRSFLKPALPMPYMITAAAASTNNTHIVGDQLFLEEQTATAKTLIVDGKMFLVPATAGGGSTVYPYGQQHLDRQFAGMAAAKLGGVLQ